jgi:hypothetical protein
MDSFKKRWGITSNFQLFIIIIVFAITGSVSAWLSKPICIWLGITKVNFHFWFTPIRLLLIFPIYQLLLVSIGFVFGQFQFFWTFEKNMLKRMGLNQLFKRK